MSPPTSTTIDPRFLAHVARVTAEVLKRGHTILDAPDAKTKAAAAAIAESPTMEGHARSLKKAATPPREKKPKQLKRFTFLVPRGYYQLPENLPQPRDATAEVFIEKGKSLHAQLGTIDPALAICGAWMFYHLKRVASDAAFEVATIEFTDGRSIDLNADCHVAVENLILRCESSEMNVDFGFDDGNGPFTMRLLGNRHYRRHSVTLTVPWDHRATLRRVGKRSNDPVEDDNSIGKCYFDVRKVLTFAERACDAAIGFVPVIKLRGSGLIKARDLVPGMKIEGGTKEDSRPSFTVKSVSLSVSTGGGICVYGDATMPFYRLHGVPIFATPSSLKAQWNEAMAPV